MPLIMKQFCFLIVFCFVVYNSVAQNGTTTNEAAGSTFEKWSSEMKDYTVDTSSAPDDRITKKIIELRRVKGEFNINEVINIKLHEDLQKQNSPNNSLEQLSQFYQSGAGKRWLDNAVIWIYRKHFTYKELTSLVKFYKTSAGQKLTSTFPVILMQSSKAAEQINELFKQQQH